MLQVFDEFCDFVIQALDPYAFFLYFLWNRSIRPAVSTSFCLPVKKGWHFEQISRWISALVERVLNVSPHAHLTTASTYSGCMFAFISLQVTGCTHYLRFRAIALTLRER